MAKRNRIATRRRIVEQTASLLNSTGYMRASMSEIMKATGLQKGGIYHHFASREELVLETFWYLTGMIRDRIGRILKRDQSTREKLLGLIEMFRQITVDDALRGGCPILNLAMESGAASPNLRAASREAIALLTGVFERVISAGVSAGELAPGSARPRAAYLVAALEGGVMLSARYDSPIYIDAVARSLEMQVRDGLRQVIAIEEPMAA